MHRLNSARWQRTALCASHYLIDIAVYVAINAIRAATINTANLFKIKDRGQIKTGFTADIIGVNEDPLAHINTLEDVKFVMKDGKVFKL